MQNNSLIPTNDVIEQTASSLTNNGFSTQVVADGVAALEALKKLIPANSEVMTGSSTTLNEIGFSDYLASDAHPWKSVHSQITSEDDEAKRAELRRKSITAEYYVASANALTQDGKIVAVDMSGSRVGAFLYGAKNLVLVVGVQKIADNLDAALTRVREVVFPLEDARAQKAYGMHSKTAKWAIMEFEGVKNRVHVILVKEALGF